MGLGDMVQELRKIHALLELQTCPLMYSKMENSPQATEPISELVIFIYQLCVTHSQPRSHPGEFTVCSLIDDAILTTHYESPYRLYPVNTSDQLHSQVFQRTTNLLQKWKRMKTLKSSVRHYIHICWEKTQTSLNNECIFPFFIT